VELGKKVVDALYFTPLLLNHPYDSDIRYWQEAGVLGKANAMDRGLYTGQTLLHIAINLRNPELVFPPVAPRFIGLVSPAFSCYFVRDIAKSPQGEARGWDPAGIDLRFKCLALP